MRNLIIFIALFINSLVLFGQPSFDYYKNPDKVGSNDSLAFEYFKKAYYDHVLSWTKTGADSAFYYLHKAIDRDPNYGAAYALLGHIYQFLTYGNMSIELYDGQEKYAHLALKYAPKLGDSYTLMADLLWDNGYRDSAMYYLRKAVEIEPEHAGNHIWLGIRLSGTANKKTEAKQAFNYILNEIDSLYGQAYMKMGYLYKNQYKDLDSAKLYFKHANKLIDILPNKDERMHLAKAALADIEQLMGNQQEAIRLNKAFIREIKGRDLFFEFEIKKSYLDLIQLDSINRQNYKEEYISYVSEQPTKTFDELLGLGWDYYDLHDSNIYSTRLWPILNQLADSLINYENQVGDRYLGFIWLTNLTSKEYKEYQSGLDLIGKLPTDENLPPFKPYFQAVLFALNNQKEEAINMLKECKRLNMEDFKSIKDDPDFSNLKDDRRFVKLFEN